MTLQSQPTQKLPSWCLMTSHRVKNLLPFRGNYHISYNLSSWYSVSVL